LTELNGSHLPDGKLSEAVRGPDGQPAVMIDSIVVVPGQRVALTFETVGPRWRQGVFLATNGQLMTANEASRALVLWSDTAPTTSLIEIAETDGRLVLYNVWDSGRGIRRFESQSHTSGMLVEKLADGSRRYSCTDIGAVPDFGRLVFRISID